MITFAWGFAVTMGIYVAGGGKCLDFQSAKNSLDGIFFIHPKVELASRFIDQLIGTIFLLFLIRAVTDSRNSSPLSNLARDFGPRLLATVGVWGGVPFTEDSGY